MAVYPGDRRLKDRRAHNKEFNYVLQIREEDLRLIQDHQHTLTQGVANFADVYYNYLFDNPSTAEVLYNCERQGGNISEFVRAHLRQLAKIPTGVVDTENAAELVKIGRLNHRWAVGPIWVMGAIRLYLEHLRQLTVNDPSIDPDVRPRLDSALVKLMYRALGIMLQGYWEATLEGVEEGRAASSPDYLQLIDILRNIPLVVWSVEVPNQRVSFASPAARSICDDEISGPVPCLDRVHDEDKERVLMAWEQSLNGHAAKVECRADLGIGGERTVRFLFTPAVAKKGKVTRVDGLLEDRTEERESLTRLEQIATTDQLTGLANRMVWNDRMGRALASNRRNGANQSVVMMLDLNHFKSINDTFGHAAGDEVLKQVAGRLGSTLRESDTIARMGGDEFAILLPNVEGAQKAGERVANKLQECFRAPVSYQGEELYVSAALGIAISPEHGEDTEKLMQRADVAMYRAKQANLPYLFYHPESDVSAGSKLQFTRQLQHALAGNQFELYYQPKLDIGTGKFCGAEALLRWQHPDEGLILPNRFISVADRIGLMVPITDWVLVTALRCCKKWNADGLHAAVAVNVSARSFQDSSLLGKVRGALSEAGVDGNLLEIEITEDALMTDLQHGSKMVEQLTELGVAVAVDDFGAGYSSLSYLKQLPVQSLKIDKSFLANITGAGNDVAIVRSIIELGHNLGCKVVAEGIENDAAWSILTELGCDQGQGYHISHPLSERGFKHWLSDTGIH